MRFRIWFAMTPGRAMLSAPVARSIPVRCDSRSVPMVDGRGSQLGRHPADFDIDAVLVGGGDHPLRAVAGRVAESASALVPSRTQGLEGLVRRVLMRSRSSFRASVSSTTTRRSPASWRASSRPVCPDNRR